MPEILDPAFFPPPPSPFFGGGDDDDDQFGDFTFAPSSSSFNPNPNPIPNTNGAHLQPHHDAGDDDWGDFVTSPLHSGSDPLSPPVWEKPRGPLPLSLFGADDDGGGGGDEQPLDLELVGPSGVTRPSPLGSPASAGAGAGDLKDLIANLYALPPAAAAKGNGDAARAEEDGFEENGWDFKVAALPSPKEGGYDDEHRHLPNGNDIKGLTKSESGQSSSDLFSNNEVNSSFETDENHSIKSAGDNYLLDFYHRLREESSLLVACHLENIKVAGQNALGEEDKATKIELEIEEFYGKPLTMGFKDFSVEDWPSREVSMAQLLKSIKEVHLKDFEQEYSLSEKMSLALEHVNSAIELCKHSSSVLNILQFAPREDQYDYVVAWHSILLSCAEELQCGAMIWTESHCVNVQEQMLSQGAPYFVALAEIYRVAEILRFSIRCFKPWVLSEPGKSSEILTCLDRCSKAWTTGLHTAVKRISDIDQAYASVADALLKSIKNIDELGVLDLQNRLLNNEIICKISLVPISLLPEMKVVVWNRDNYFMKVANFWANRISCDPPQLPPIHFRVMNNE